MNPAPHPDYAKVLDALRPLKAHAAPYTVTLYRCVETAFAQDFISGRGAQLHGGRWNPRGAFPAVYLSDSPETALAEYLARTRRMRLPEARALPMVMAAAETRVSSALDLDTPPVAALLQPFLVSEKAHWRAIQDRREAISQAIGRALHRLGVGALLAASQARPAGRTHRPVPGHVWEPRPPLGSEPQDPVRNYFLKYCSSGPIVRSCQSH